MINILCDICKRKIGEIEENTHVVSFDPYVGIEKICKECKGKTLVMGSINENQLISGV